MCGLAGMIDWRVQTTADELRAIGESMNRTLAHRGPDADDVWISAESGTVLAHRRLAIIDLSAGGAQPMHSRDGRYVIILNGEIYNHRDMRAELAATGRHLRSVSDTEVLLEACALWGVRGACERAIGMFAFALWDRHTRTLSLARDRLGIKPMYYAESPERFLFASQLKAFHHAPGFVPSIDAGAVVGYLRVGYIAQPRTVYRGAAKLPPGHILTVRAGGPAQLACFWDARALAQAGADQAWAPIDEREAVERLDVLLRDAMRLHMIADVPLGAFLSGGIDSSTVVALMQAQSGIPVKTFSIGFREAGYDEAGYARRIAAHLGSEHREFYIDASHAQEIIPRLPDWYDEPFADVSQIPTCLVSEMTRQHVTVALSGDGGDELFAGYERYLWAQRLTSTMNGIPKPVKAGLKAVLQALPPRTWNRLFCIVPASWRPELPGDRLHKLATMLGNSEPDAIYRRLVSFWEQPQEIAVAGTEPTGPLWDDSLASDFPDRLSRMQFVDLATYLPDDILTKVDRATMAAGLEARVPLLDHRVVEFSWSLPRRLKVRRGQGKWILRRVLQRYVPEALFDRAKMGFGVPIGTWIRGPLRDWAESLLSESRLKAGGLVQPALVRQAWHEHLTGMRNWQYPLWTVLMLEAWRERWGG